MTHNWCLKTAILDRVKLEDKAEWAQTPAVNLLSPDTNKYKKHTVSLVGILLL